MQTGGIKSWWLGRYRIQAYWPRLGLTEFGGMYQGWYGFETSARFGFSRAQWLGGFKLFGFGVGVHCHPLVEEKVLTSALD